MFALFGDMRLDVFSENFTNVTWFCLGTWTEHVARVLIRVLAEVYYYMASFVN